MRPRPLMPSVRCTPWTHSPLLFRHRAPRRLRGMRRPRVSQDEPRSTPPEPASLGYHPSRTVRTSTSTVRFRRPAREHHQYRAEGRHPRPLPAARRRGCRASTACAPRSSRRWASTSTPFATPTSSSRASRRRSCATGPTSSVPRTAPRSSELLSELVLGLLDSPLTDEQFSLMLRGLLTWCGEALGRALA